MNNANLNTNPGLNSSCPLKTPTTLSSFKPSISHFRVKGKFSWYINLLAEKVNSEWNCMKH